MVRASQPVWTSGTLRNGLRPSTTCTSHHCWAFSLPAPLVCVHFPAACVHVYQPIAYSRPASRARSFLPLTAHMHVERDPPEELQVAEALL